jgi:LPS-assembly lipoprotein
MQRPFLPALAALALLGALPLTGCGFTPLYGTPGMVPSLDAIDVVVERVQDPRNVDTLQNRIHFLLREQLNDELGHRNGAPVRYQLVCKTTERRVPRGVRVNNVANRYEIDFTVDYTLTAAGGTQVLLHSSEPVIVVYDSADPPYAGVSV